MTHQPCFVSSASASQCKKDCQALEGQSGWVCVSWLSVAVGGFEALSVTRDRWRGSCLITAGDSWFVLT